jgi:hypothetical protein
MHEGPSLGYSAISKATCSSSRFDAVRRLGFLLVALIVVGAVFYCLTRTVQSSTAHATRDASPIHSDQ